jgi:hypothetical protein
MPNWPLATRIRNHVQAVGLRYAMRPMDLARADFPLSVGEIQDHLTGLTQDQIAMLRRLDAEGVKTIEHHRELRLAFLREKFPELRRALVLHLRVPQSVFVGRGTQWNISTTKFDINENHYLVPDPDLTGMSPELRARLIPWLEGFLRQRRLFEITENVLGELIVNDEKIIPTAAHLHAFWPLATTLVDPSRENYPSDREYLAKWVARFQAPTRSLKPYKPDPDVKNKWAKLILAAESQIVAGRMLPSAVSAFNLREDIVPAIEHWERLQGDVTFPLPE